MVKKYLWATSFSLLLCIPEGMCGRLVQYENAGIADPHEDSSPYAKKNGVTITIKDVIQEDLLLDGDNPEGINLAANILTSKGVRELINTITNNRYTQKFSQLKYLKLLSNPVDETVLEVCRPLLERSNFEFLDLCETRAIANPKFSSLLQNEFKDVASKVIFIPFRYLDHFKYNPDEIDPKILDQHKKYYKLKIWSKK